MGLTCKLACQRNLVLALTGEPQRCGSVGAFQRCLAVRGPLTSKNELIPDAGRFQWRPERARLLETWRTGAPSPAINQAEPTAV